MPLENFSTIIVLSATVHLIDLKSHNTLFFRSSYEEYESLLFPALQNHRVRTFHVRTQQCPLRPPRDKIYHNRIWSQTTFLYDLWREEKLGFEKKKKKKTMYLWYYYKRAQPKTTLNYSSQYVVFGYKKLITNNTYDMQSVKS